MEYKRKFEIIQGITEDGKIIDFNSEDLKLHNFKSVIVREVLSVEEFKQIYGDCLIQAKIPNAGLRAEQLSKR